MPTYKRKNTSEKDYECSVVKSTVVALIETEQVSRFNDFRDLISIHNRRILIISAQRFNYIATDISW